MAWRGLVRRWLRIAVGVLSLAGCVQTPPQQAVISGRSDRDASALLNWQAQGRLGVNSPEQSGSGSFMWQQNGVASEVAVRGPAGMGAMLLTFDGQLLRLRTGDGAEMDGNRALEQLAQRLGVAIPVQAWRYWLRGLSAPNEPMRWLDTERNQLEQQGWLIQYDTWTSHNQLRLPTRLTMVSGELRVLVKIQHWQIND